MNAKIVIVSVAGMAALVGGAVLAGRIGGEQSESETRGVQDKASASERPVETRPEAVELDTREVEALTEPTLSIDLSSAAPGGARFIQRTFENDGLLERFDSDGDGELSEAEREASLAVFRQEREQRRQQWLLEQYDKDGDGVLSPVEKEAQEADRVAREAARTERMEAMKRRALEAYDADGDGELSESERAAGRQAMQEHFAKQFEAMNTIFDADGDGSLSGAERTAMHEAMGQVFSERRFVQSYDADGDHAITPADMPAYMDLFSAADGRADVDGNGVVNAADLAEFQRRALSPLSPQLTEAMAWFNRAPPPVDFGFGGQVMTSSSTFHTIDGATVMIHGGGGPVAVTTNVLHVEDQEGSAVLVIERIEIQDDE